MMVLPSRDRTTNPDKVSVEIDKLAINITVKILEPPGEHFRNIITETMRILAYNYPYQSVSD